MSASNPISPKVVAAAAGAGAGVILSNAALWAIGAGFFHAGWTADQADNAIAAVPSHLAGLIYLLVTVVGAAIPGYQVTDPARVVPAEPSTEEHLMIEAEIGSDPADEPDTGFSVGHARMDSDIDP